LGDYLLLIVLWNWGEPFLNPDLFKMIAYAKSRKIVVHSSTNGQVRFDGASAGELVESGLDSLVFGIDGATPETYVQYRKGGNLERVLENVKTIVRAKERRGSLVPRLTLRFVAMRQNEQELPLAYRLAQELGVDFFAVKTVDMPAALGKNLDSVFAPGTHEYQRYEYEEGSFRRNPKPFTCMRPWKSWAGLTKRARFRTWISCSGPGHKGIGSILPQTPLSSMTRIGQTWRPSFRSPRSTLQT
jgi:MoaA/NifB/PqqE/SkfB family radical SAM enzyme